MIIGIDRRWALIEGVLKRALQTFAKNRTTFFMLRKWKYTKFPDFGMCSCNHSFFPFCPPPLRSPTEWPKCYFWDAMFYHPLLRTSITMTSLYFWMHLGIKPFQYSMTRQGRDIHVLLLIRPTGLCHLQRLQIDLSHCSKSFQIYQGVIKLMYFSQFVISYLKSLAYIFTSELWI